MIAFPISPRFTPEIVAHLITVVKPKHILVNNERVEILDQCMQLLESKEIPSISLMPTHNYMFRAKDLLFKNETLRETDRTALIIHSSGTV